MESQNLRLYNQHNEVIQEKGTNGISASNHVTYKKSDSFTMYMKHLPPLMDNHLTLDSRLDLQGSLSRKWAQEGAENTTTNPATTNNKRGDSFPPTVTEGSTHHNTNSLVHHQITIMTGGADTPAAISAATTTANSDRAFSGTRLIISKRSRKLKQSSFIISPRKILFFFASLSSIGTILLIYCTLCMTKNNGDDNSPG